MSAVRVPIPKHPGYWRRGDRVTFKYRDERRRQRWASAPTIAEAKRLRAQLETDASRGELGDRSTVKFAPYARSWVETCPGRTRNGITEQTREGYRRVLEQDAIPYLGEMRLSEIRPVHIKGLATHVADRGVKQNTVRLVVAPVKALLADAFEEGTIRINPAAGVRIVTPRPQLVGVEEEDLDDDVKALTADELAGLLKAIAKRSSRWHLFFWTLADLGLRIGEAVELRWKDVDLGKRQVRVRRKFYRGAVGRPKSRYGRRTLELTPELARALWTLRGETRAVDEDLVFTAERGGRIQQSNLMSRVLKPAAAAAGLGEMVKNDRGALVADSWVGFHTFRHTCATALFRVPWNVVQVQRWLGHHKPSFTIDKYVHLLEGDMPAPVSIAQGGTQSGTQSGRDEPRTEAADAAGISDGYAESPAAPRRAETA